MFFANTMIILGWDECVCVIEWVLRGAYSSQLDCCQLIMINSDGPNELGSDVRHFSCLATFKQNPKGTISSKCFLARNFPGWDKGSIKPQIGYLAHPKRGRHLCHSDKLQMPSKHRHMTVHSSFQRIFRPPAKKQNNFPATDRYQKPIQACSAHANNHSQNVAKAVSP